MSYTALYRKFRPTVFEDVKGQEHIVTTLKNQIRSGRTSHAYLFCGTRGTGKTTIAKIFAKAVNCEHPVDGSPCGECAICRSIAAGTSMNVIEIDAASNNGVDSIRQIVEEVNYSPAEGKYKVYIIDEVHMLSIGAFNALLKTLEEPPAYVIFILATTEVHKIPITILSRCQRYDFRRISIDTIADRLKELTQKEQVQIEEKAVRYIAKVADGSMRDALSLLDQCIAFYFEQELTYDKVLDVLGAVDTGVFSRMLREILKGDAAAALGVLQDIVLQGRELSQFVTDFAWYLRNLLLVKSSDQMEDVLDMSSENLALLKEEADMIEGDVIMRYIRIFSDLSGQLKYAPQKRVLIEIALIKLCRPAMETTQDALTDRVAQLEKKVEEGVTVVAAAPAVQPASGSAPATPQKPKEPAQMPKAIPDDIRQVAKNWSSIVRELPGVTATYLRSAHLSLGGENKLMLVFDDDLAYTYVSEERRRTEITERISNRIGKEIEVVMQSNDSGRPFEENYIDLEQIVHMDIEVEDE